MFIFLFWLGNRPSIKLIELTNITFLMRSFEDKNIQNKWVDYNSDRLSTSKMFLVLVFSWGFSGEGDSPGRRGGGGSLIGENFPGGNFPGGSLPSTVEMGNWESGSGMRGMQRISLGMREIKVGMMRMRGIRLGM